MRPQNDRSPDTSHLYAWLSRDADGIEGLVVASLGTVLMQAVPLVTADEALARRLRPFAENAAIQREFTARLVRFSRDPGAPLDVVDP
jgi:hypothetical protein